MIYKKFDKSTDVLLDIPPYLREPEPVAGPGLPRDAAARKAVPIVTGVLDYFPDAIAAVAECSRIGNEQHNPGSPLHWDRSKSGDESDALGRIVRYATGRLPTPDGTRVVLDRDPVSLL